ncbi:MAG: nitroreductase family protein [Bdellovibrionia bacterium]
MDFFETVRTRRSIRKYSQKPVPPEVIQNALNAALLAPNSSNLQTWEFYWVRSAQKKKELIEACFHQSAARTAQELVVIVANPSLWKITNPLMIEFIKKIQAPKMVQQYYEKLIPLTYGANWLAPVKALGVWITGWFRPISRGPLSFRDLQEVSIKSAALASENFMLAITAQGYCSCPMEGLDEKRVRSLLSLQRGSRVVMAISVGEEEPGKGTWGPQIRFDRNLFVKEV